MINNVKGSINKELISRLKQTYSGKPWYGKSVKAVLALTDDQLPDKVLTLVNHMIAWRNYVAAVLEHREYKIKIDSDEDWPVVNQGQNELLAALDDSQNELIIAISEFDAQKWKNKIPDARYSYFELCQGIIDHDIYHTGQIALLLK